MQPYIASISRVWKPSSKRIRFFRSSSILHAPWTSCSMATSEWIRYFSSRLLFKWQREPLSWWDSWNAELMENRGANGKLHTKRIELVAKPVKGQRNRCVFDSWLLFGSDSTTETVNHAFLFIYFELNDWIQCCTNDDRIFAVTKLNRRNGDEIGKSFTTMRRAEGREWKTRMKLAPRNWKEGMAHCAFLLESEIFLQCADFAPAYHPAFGIIFI